VINYRRKPVEVSLTPRWPLAATLEVRTERPANAQRLRR
jgi:hypothetical protein